MSMSANDFAVKKATEFLERCPPNALNLDKRETTATTSSESMNANTATEQQQQASSPTITVAAGKSTNASSNASQSHQQLSPKALKKAKSVES